VSAVGAVIFLVQVIKFEERGIVATFVSILLFGAIGVLHIIAVREDFFFIGPCVFDGVGFLMSIATFVLMLQDSGDDLFLSILKYIGKFIDETDPLVVGSTITICNVVCCSW